MQTEKIKLEADEVVLLEVRKHWFVLFLQVIFVIILALFPLIFLALIYGTTFDPTLLPVLNMGVVLSLYSAWLIVMWMALFSVWTNYYLDIWTITNRRLIAVDQRGFFSRTVGSFRLERMQDITVTVNGIIATFLDFGTLDIQTAGVENNFKVSGIPNPADIKSTILAASDALMPRAPERQNHDL